MLVIILLLILLFCGVQAIKSDVETSKQDESIFLWKKGLRIRTVNNKYAVEHSLFGIWSQTYNENDNPCVFDSLGEAKKWIQKDEDFLTWVRNNPD